MSSISLVLIIWVISLTEVEDVLQTESTDKIEKEPSYFLTLPSDTLRFERHQVKRGESFGALLGKRGISTAQIYKIAAAVEDEFNVRRIRAGAEVQFATGDSSLFPAFFIYPESKFEYWVIGLRDSIFAKKVEKHRRYANALFLAP